MPEGWRPAKLGDVLVSVRNGLSLNQEKDGVGYRVTRIETIAEDRIDPTRVGYVRNVSQEQLNKFRLNPGDILVSHINSEPQIGRSVMYDGNPPVLLHGMNLLRLEVRRDVVDPTFLNFLLRFYREEGVFMALASRAVGQSSINQGKLKALQILIPALRQQRWIAHVLSTIQRAIEAQDKVIAAARELKRSLMKHLFTYGPVPITETYRVPLKETEIGQIPDHSQLCTVGETGQVITGTTPRTAEPDFYGGPFMFVSPGDIGECKRVERTEKHLTERGMSVSRVLPRNSVLVVCIGATIGKVAMTLAEQCATNQQINAIVPNKEFCPDFLYYAVSHCSRHLPSLAGRAAVPIVNKANFEQFRLPYPRAEEQEEIARTLSPVDNKLEFDKKRKAALQALFKTMLHHLMTGKIRVWDV
jgi:type I restriction enzyme S subunit